MHRDENDVRNMASREGNGERHQPLVCPQILSSTDDARRYKFGDSIRGSWDADGGVLLDLGRGNLIRVNPVAGLILKGIDQGESECEIAQGIAGKCEADFVTVRADVHQFCKLLEQQGLIVEVQLTPASA
jgi:Coenzyme PQQ synthesis protein D (PqqD)